MTLPCLAVLADLASCSQPAGVGVVETHLTAVTIVTNAAVMIVTNTVFTNVTITAATIVTNTAVTIFSNSTVKIVTNTAIRLHRLCLNLISVPVKAASCEREFRLNICLKK